MMMDETTGAAIRVTLYEELLVAFDGDARAALKYLESPKPCREQATSA